MVVVIISRRNGSSTLNYDNDDDHNSSVEGKKEKAKNLGMGQTRCQLSQSNTNIK
jgi:hypothetical protein